MLTPTQKSSNFKSIADQYSQTRTVSSMYESAETNYDNTDMVTRSTDAAHDSRPKIKFVPKKDRQKNVTKSKKSRWSVQADEEAEISEAVETNSMVKTEPLAQDTASAGTSGIAGSSGTTDKPQVAASAVPDNLVTQTQLMSSFTAQNGVEVRTPPSTDGEDSYTPALPPNININKAEAEQKIELWTKNQQEVEVNTPPTSDGDDDEAWMPALPPGLGDTQSSTANNRNNDSSGKKHDRLKKVSLMVKVF